jgi:hypothetical protein
LGISSEAPKPAAPVLSFVPKHRFEIEEDTMITQELEREAWDRIAAGYDQFVTPTETWLANEALTRARLTSGERFLDVAAGCGG